MADHAPGAMQSAQQDAVARLTPVIKKAAGVVDVPEADRG